jgi:hypothetical protein
LQTSTIVQSLRFQAFHYPLHQQQYKRFSDIKSSNILLMDKKAIKAAVDVLMSARKYSQVVAPTQQSPGNTPIGSGLQQSTQPSNKGVVVIPLGGAGANTPLFKEGISNSQLASVAIATHDQDLRVPEKVSSIINNALYKAGYNPKMQYNQQQQDEFAGIIAKDLQNYFSQFGDILQVLAVH